MAWQENNKPPNREPLSMPEGGWREAGLQYDPIQRLLEFLFPGSPIDARASSLISLELIP
jgi:hypothetical protein